MNCYILADDGETPIRCDDVHEFGRWFNTVDRTLDVTVIPYVDMEAIQISTVFLGFDHSFVVGPPILWETMVFGGPSDNLQRRYSSAREARAGHACIVSLVRSQLLALERLKTRVEAPVSD